MSESTPPLRPDGSPIIAELRIEGVFAHMTEGDLVALKQYGQFEDFPAHTTIIQEGTLQDHLYYIVHGTTEVVVKYAGKETLLGVLGQGDSFGEISVFEPGPTSATVRTKEFCVIWKIDVPSLQSYFEKLPGGGGQLMLGLAQLLSKRLRRANQALVEASMLPKHLAVRSGNAPITAATVAEEEDSSSNGLFGSLMGSNKKLPSVPPPKISDKIKL